MNYLRIQDGSTFSPAYLQIRYVKLLQHMRTTVIIIAFLFLVTLALYLSLWHALCLVFNCFVPWSYALCLTTGQPTILQSRPRTGVKGSARGPSIMQISFRNFVNMFQGTEDIRFLALWWHDLRAALHCSFYLGSASARVRWTCGVNGRGF